MPHAHIDVSVAINASAQTVFDRMQNLARLNEWNPFPEMDKTATSKHEGPDSGVGSIFTYEGKQLGKGRMEIVSVEAPRQVDIKMTFWQGEKEQGGTSAFVIADGPGDSVIVHWVFDQDRGFGMWLAGKVVFDRMMGGTFTKGLQKLKVLIETGN